VSSSNREIDMKATALIAAAALLCGTGAFAQQYDNNTHRSTDGARVEHQDPSSTGSKLRNGMHRLGEKTRNAFHRMGEKLHAKRDEHNDTHAMGASGRDHDSRDAASARQQRMDEAYANYHARQDKNR
jgi:hypothetical protein